MRNKKATHSHVDHYGGVRGVVDEKDVKVGKVKIYAPKGFLEHAVSDSLLLGNLCNCPPSLSQQRDELDFLNHSSRTSAMSDNSDCNIATADALTLLLHNQHALGAAIEEVTKRLSKMEWEVPLRTQCRPWKRWTQMLKPSQIPL